MSNGDLVMGHAAFHAHTPGDAERSAFGVVPKKLSGRAVAAGKDLEAALATSSGPIEPGAAPKRWNSSGMIYLMITPKERMPIAAFLDRAMAEMFLTHVEGCVIEPREIERSN